MSLFDKLYRPISEIAFLRKIYLACGLATVAVLSLLAIADIQLNIRAGGLSLANILWTVWSLLSNVGPTAILLFVVHRRMPGFQMVVLVSSILQGAISPGVWVWLTGLPSGEGMMALAYMHAFCILIALGTWFLFYVC